MKAGMSHLLSLMIIMALTVLPLSLDGQGTRTNFSGTWVYNAEKSNTGQVSGQGQGRGGFAGGDFTVKQEAIFSPLKVPMPILRDRAVQCRHEVHP